MLAETLAAVLSLQMQDVEFIVCDNASVDHTGDICRSVSDTRLKYYRSDARLSMPENFERGLNLATGDYIITMGDDDFIIEENLILALRQAQETGCDLVHWFRGCFYWGSYPEPLMASTFQIPTGRNHYPVDAVTMMNTAYQGLVNYFYLPGAYNSLIKRSFLERVKKFMRGRFFPDYAVAVDCFSALTYCSLAPSVYYQQSPAVVSGISHHSNGMSVFNGGKEFARFSKELGRSETDFLMPEEFKGYLEPRSSTALNELQIMIDFFNIRNRLLKYNTAAAPSLEALTRRKLRMLVGGQHIAIDESCELYKKYIVDAENDSVPGEDMGTYFYNMWSIPFPQMYAARFETNIVTSRHMTAHLLSIGFNKAAA